MICSNCSGQVTGNASFCAHCGSVLGPLRLDLAAAIKPGFDHKATILLLCEVFHKTPEEVVSFLKGKKPISFHDLSIEIIQTYETALEGSGAIYRIVREASPAPTEHVIHVPDQEHSLPVIIEKKTGLVTIGQTELPSDITMEDVARLKEAVRETTQHISRNHRFTPLLLIVLALAFFLRLPLADKGLPYLHHWDEPQVSSTALNMMKTGDMDPHFYSYGTVLTYLSFLTDIIHYVRLSGNPEESGEYIERLGDIETEWDTGWHWSISHPSFYRANRIMVTILAVLSVLMTFLIGRELFNRWVGLLAALFLALNPYHILHSAYVTPNVPVGLFVLLVTFFALRYLKSGSSVTLLWSLVFVGVSIATKYNAGLFLLVPILAVLWRWMRHREISSAYHFLLTISVPFIVFIICMPYAVLNFSDFLRDVGFEIRHYNILGHNDATVKPGLSHLLVQLKNFSENLSFLIMGIALTGIIGAVLKPRFGFVLIVPLLYFLYMINTTVDFHRNFILHYAFIGLLFASGVYYLFFVCSSWLSRQVRRNREIAFLVTLALAAAALLPQGYRAVVNAREASAYRESRSIAIDTLNTHTEIKQLVIAEELRLHPLDLKRLTKPYRIVSLQDMRCLNFPPESFLVIPRELNRGGDASYKDDFVLKLNEFRLLRKMVSAAQFNPLVIGDSNPLLLARYSEDPAILITPAPVEKSCPAAASIAFNELGAPLHPEGTGDFIFPLRRYQRGRYLIGIEGNGIEQDNEAPSITVFVEAILHNMSRLEIASRQAEMQRQVRDYLVLTRITAPLNVSVRLSYPNRSLKKYTMQERYTYIHSLIVQPLPAPGKKEFASYRMIANRPVNISIPDAGEINAATLNIALKGKGTYGVSFFDEAGSKIGSTIVHVIETEDFHSYSLDLDTLIGQQTAYAVEITPPGDRGLEYFLGNISLDQSVAEEGKAQTAVSSALTGITPLQKALNTIKSLNRYKTIIIEKSLDASDSQLNSLDKPARNVSVTDLACRAFDPATLILLPASAEGMAPPERLSYQRIINDLDPKSIIRQIKSQGKSQGILLVNANALKPCTHPEGIIPVKDFKGTFITDKSSGALVLLGKTTVTSPSYILGKGKHLLHFRTNGSTKSGKNQAVLNITVTTYDERLESGTAKVILTRNLILSRIRQDFVLPFSVENDQRVTVAFTPDSDDTQGFIFTVGLIHDKLSQAGPPVPSTIKALNRILVLYDPSPRAISSIDLSIGGKPQFTVELLNNTGKKLATLTTPPLKNLKTLTLMHLPVPAIARGEQVNAILISPPSDATSTERGFFLGHLRLNE